MAGARPVRVAVFDCFSGIAGDMTLAALIDAGASIHDVTAGLERLGLPPFTMGLERVTRGGITANLLQLSILEERTLQPDQMRAMIRAATFPARVQERAMAAVDALEAGEAEAHGTPAPHLHEAGGIDAMIDICGTMLALEALDIDTCSCPVVVVGSGSIARTAHGRIPASPGPAAAAILRRHAFPMRFVEASHELVTPTGAAILAAVATPNALTLTVTQSGCGAGTFDPAERPNALRIFVGEAAPEQRLREVSELAANIDDMTPAMLAAARDAIMDAGALDAWTEAIGMKKGRPAVKLCALVPAGAEERFAALFLRETTTLGVRFVRYQRFEAGREIVRFESTLGPVAVKVSVVEGQRRANPEFEEVRRIARERNQPVIEVQSALELELRQWLRDEPANG